MTIFTKKKKENFSKSESFIENNNIINCTQKKIKYIYKKRHTLNKFQHYLPLIK